MDVRFDAPDAIESLDRFDLWADRSCLRVVDPAEAITRLKNHWGERRTAGYHLHLADEVIHRTLEQGRMLTRGQARDCR